MSPHLFSIRWSGSVFAPETGEYEFVVRSEHGTQLWLNDRARPLIDAPVRSKDDTESRATIFLLGGRSYPLKLEFIKIVGQEDDSKEEKAKRPSVKASIALLWKPPQRAVEVDPAPQPLAQRRSGDVRGGDAVPGRRPQLSATSVVSRSPRTGTRPRRKPPSRSRTTSAGTSTELAGVGRRSGPIMRKRLREFCLRFAEAAFRRPLTERSETALCRSPVRPGRQSRSWP